MLGQRAPTFDVVHQADDLLGEGAGVCGALAGRPRGLQQGQEIQTLAADVHQVQRQLPVCGAAQHAARDRQAVRLQARRLRAAQPVRAPTAWFHTLPPLTAALPHQLERQL